MKTNKRNDRLQVPMTIEWNGKNRRKDFLGHIIETNNFKTLVEVGTRYGGTIFYLLDRFPQLKVYAIDSDISQFYNSTVAEKYGDRLIAIEGLSQNVAKQIPDNSIDLIFIDANHNYPYVKNDIKDYRKKLNDKGIMTGHDIDYPGVNKAVNELIESYDVGPNFVWVANKFKN